MPSTDIYILGQKYTIKGEKSDKHIKMLEAYIDERLKEVLDKHPNITPLKALILATLNIADELHGLKAEQDDITRAIEQKTEMLAGLLES